MRCPPIRLLSLAQSHRLKRLLPRGPIALAAILTLCLLPFLVHALVKRETPGNQAADKQAQKLARLNETVSVHAAGRGNPTINLSDGREVLTSYVGPPELRVALEQNLASPLSLASADFDEDGVPDLVGGYSYNGQGVVSLLRGNVDSIYPNAPEAKQRKADGTFTDAPFLSPAGVFAAPIAADFIGAGDFDGDSHWDVVVGSRTASALYLLSGDGHGGFQPAKEIQLPGNLTAMTTGEINRADGLTDVVVGVAGPSGSSVMVFEGPEGALRSQPEVFSTQSKVTSLALGEMDDDLASDLVVAAGRDLLMVRGRDRKLSLNEKSRSEVLPAAVEKRSLGFNIRLLAIGRFSGEVHPNIALLSEDGVVSFLNQTQSTTRSRKPVGSLANWNREIVPAATWPAARQLTSAHLSGNPVDELVAVDPLNHQLQVLTRSRTDANSASAFGEFDIYQTSPKEISLDLASPPLAALTMKLNSDTASDLVVLRQGQSAPIIITTTPSAIITVNSSADTNARDSVVTLREAILLSNGELLKTDLTVAEQAQVSGTPAPGLDEVRFNIPLGGISPPDSTALNATPDRPNVGEPIAGL